MAKKVQYEDIVGLNPEDLPNDFGFFIIVDKFGTTDTIIGSIDKKTGVINHIAEQRSIKVGDKEAADIKIIEFKEVRTANI